jgi:hypothetical protein
MFSNTLKTILLLLLLACATQSQVRFAVIEANNIDGKTSGAVTVGTTNGGGASQNFYPAHITIIGHTITALVTPVTLSVGTNSSTYNNLLAATLLSTSLNATNLMQVLNLAAGSPVIAHNTDIKVNVTSIAVGTAYTFDIKIFGWYE